MQKFILFFVLIVTGIPSFPQNIQFDLTTVDTTAKEVIMTGYCTRDGLEKGVLAGYFKEEYQNYKPDASVIAELSGRLDSVTTVIIMGTWCSDSREQVPRFFKILDAIKTPHGEITIICVNKQKKCRDISLDEYALTKVPTFIFKRKGSESGRIIETPVVSIEKDLLGIIDK